MSSEQLSIEDIEIGKKYVIPNGKIGRATGKRGRLVDIYLGPLVQVRLFPDELLRFRTLGSVVDECQESADVTKELGQTK